MTENQQLRSCMLNIVSHQSTKNNIFNKLYYLLKQLIIKYIYKYNIIITGSAWLR
jgi:hypothetical protein